MTEKGLVWLDSSSGISTDRDIDLGDWEFDQENGRLIDRGSSGISNYWDIDWENDREIYLEIMLEKCLVLVASPSGFYRGIVTTQLDTTVESISISHKRDYQRCV